jgi:hypothetical protein
MIFLPHQACWGHLGVVSGLLGMARSLLLIAPWPQKKSVHLGIGKKKHLIWVGDCCVGSDVLYESS